MNRRVTQSRGGCFVLLIAAAIAVWALSPAEAQTLAYWTGNAGNGLWSDAGNWKDGVIPNTNDHRAIFGNDATDGAHAIIVDAVYEIRRLEVSGSGNRSFEFTASGGGKLQFDGDAIGLLIHATAAADVVINVPVEVTYSGAAWFLRNNGSHSLQFTSSFNGGGPAIGIQYGDIRFTGAVSRTGTLWDISSAVSTSPALTWTLNPTSFPSSYLRFVSGSDAEVRFETDVTFTFLEAHTAYTGAIFFQGVGAGAGDRTVSFGNAMRLTGNDDGYLTFLDNELGDSGRFILRNTGHTADGSHYLPIQTLANTVIKFDAVGVDNSAELTYAVNSNRAARISGAGSLWKANTATLLVKTENTYTGRTMISGGTLRLSSHTLGDDTFHGQLPTGTVVELGTGATFDLNTIDQTVGGLRGFRGLNQDQGETYGTVALNGATLTINAAEEATSFGGAITGTGALVKAGAETFTLSAGYSNAANRTLRVEGGMLAVNGALSVEDGTFELAGGQITADSLAAAGTVWNVTLAEANEGQTLVNIASGAAITGASLNLTLAAGYEPVYGKTFTLLYADTITGAESGGDLFQYEDGVEFEQGGQEYRIQWVDGSGSIVLTVIPEPGILALLAPGLACLYGVRRRRRG